MSGSWPWAWFEGCRQQRGAGSADCLKATVNKSQSACYYHYVPVILNNISDKIPSPPKMLLRIPFSQETSVRRHLDYITRFSFQLIIDSSIKFKKAIGSTINEFKMWLTSGLRKEKKSPYGCRDTAAQNQARSLLNHCIPTKGCKLPIQQPGIQTHG